MRTRMRTAALSGATAIALLALGACASNSSSPPPAGAPPSSGAAAEPDASASSTAESDSGGAPGDTSSLPITLDGVTMVATEVAGAHTIVPGSQISLTLKSDGTIGANAGCNFIGGSYTLVGSVLNAPRLGQTAMACVDQRDATQDPTSNGPVMDQEIWFIEFLESSPTFAFDNGNLTLTNGTDTIAMTSAPSDAEALTATGWKLVVLISPGNYEPVDARVSAWMRFDGGQVAFDTSCNRGGGSADVTDENITFGPLRTTRLSCDGASGNTDGAMNAVLAGTTTYRLEDPSRSTLTITSQDGAKALQFSADPTVGADAFADPAGPGSAGVTAPTN